MNIVQKPYEYYLKLVENKSRNEAFSFSKERELKDAVKELEQKLQDLKDQRHQLDVEMEDEAGAAGDSWTDIDANRYGDLMNTKDEEIEKAKKALEKAKLKLQNHGVPSSSRVNKLEEEPMGTIKANLEDITKSIKAWPERTNQEQAAVIKKRYSIYQDTNAIIDALKQLDLL